MGSHPWGSCPTARRNACRRLPAPRPSRRAPAPRPGKARSACAARLSKTLSENFPVSLEQRRISPRMGLPPSPFSKGDAPYGRGYHNAENGLLPDAEAIVEETQEIPAQAKEESKRERRQAQSLREGSRRRHLVCALDRMPMEGSPSRLVWGLLKRRPRAFPEVERGRHIREA